MNSFTLLKGLKLRCIHLWSWSGMESDVDKSLSITLEELVIGRLPGFWHSTWVQEMQKQNPESLKYRVWFFRTGVFLNIFSHNFALYLCRSSPHLKIRPVYYYYFFLFSLLFAFKFQVLQTSGPLLPYVLSLQPRTWTANRFSLRFSNVISNGQSVLSHKVFVILCLWKA